MAKRKTTKKTTTRRRRRTTGNGTGAKLFKLGKRQIRTKPMMVGVASVAGQAKLKSWIPASFQANKWVSKALEAPASVLQVAGGYLIKSDDTASVGVGGIVASVLNLAF